MDHEYVANHTHHTHIIITVSIILLPSPPCVSTAVKGLVRKLELDGVR